MKGADTLQHVDFAGPQGGALAIAFASGALFCAGIMLAVGKYIWSKFGEARIKQLEAENAAHKVQCAADIAEAKKEARDDYIRLTDRIKQLETLLMSEGPMAMRAKLQAIRSAESMAGSDANEGNDTRGLHAHRIPASGEPE